MSNARVADSPVVPDSANPSVVNVDTIQSVRQLDMSMQQQQTGTGSGFIWDEGGADFLRETAGHMRTWLGAIRTLAGS